MKQTEQLTIFDLIKETEGDTFDTLYDEVEEDPTADFDPNVEYFKKGEKAYCIGLDFIAYGIITKVNNTYTNRKGGALITIETDDGEQITDYQSNFTHYKPGFIHD